MENPATWGKLEKVIDEVIEDDYRTRDQVIMGLSITRKIADALRNEELVNESKSSLVLMFDNGDMNFASLYGPLDPSEYSWTLENFPDESDTGTWSIHELESFDKNNPPF